MIKVLAIPNDKGGKGFYRIYNPMRYLNDLNEDVEVIIKRFGNFRIKKTELDYFDILLMNGVGKNQAKIAQVLSSKNIKVIYDIDDLDWNLPKDHSLYEKYNKLNMKEVIKATVNSSDMIVTPSKVLKNKLKNITYKPIKLIPNAIDYKNYYWNLDNNHQDINIGWAGGSSHVPDIKIIEGIGKYISNNHKNTKFVLGGWNSRVNIIDHNKEYKRTANEYNMMYSEQSNNTWVQYEKLLFGKRNNKDLKIIRSRPTHLYPEIYSYFDIALVPLRDDKYRNSKSLIKLIEASGYEIPVITSDVLPYSNVIEDGENGFTASSKKEWKDKIDILVNNKDLRNKLSKNLKETIYPKHNINYQTDQYKDLFSDFVSKNNINVPNTFNDNSDIIKGGK